KRPNGSSSPCCTHCWWDVTPVHVCPLCCWRWDESVCVSFFRSEPCVQGCPGARAPLHSDSFSARFLFLSKESSDQAGNFIGRLVFSTDVAGEPRPASGLQTAFDLETFPAELAPAVWLFATVPHPCLQSRPDCRGCGEKGEVPDPVPVVA